MATVGGGLLLLAKQLIIHRFVMKTSKKIMLILAVAGLLVSCGGKKIKGNTTQELKGNVDELLLSLPAERRGKLSEALMAIAADVHAAAYTDSEGAFLKMLNGKTEDEILAMGKDSIESQKKAKLKKREEEELERKRREQQYARENEEREKEQTARKEREAAEVKAKDLDELAKLKKEKAHYEDIAREKAKVTVTNISITAPRTIGYVVENNSNVPLYGVEIAFYGEKNGDAPESLGSVYPNFDTPIASGEKRKFSVSVKDELAGGPKISAKFVRLVGKGYNAAFFEMNESSLRELNALEAKYPEGK